MELRATTVHRITVRNGDALRLALATAASARGYSVRHARDMTTLTRGKNVAFIQDVPDGLFVRVDDVEALPQARVADGVLKIDNLAFRLPAGARVLPLRERHVAGSKYWEAEWRVSGCCPSELALSMHNDLIARHLRSGGIWEPPGYRPNGWLVVAGSVSEHVKVFIDQNDDLLVHVERIRSRAGGDDQRSKR